MNKRKGLHHPTSEPEAILPQVRGLANPNWIRDTALFNTGLRKNPKCGRIKLVTVRKFVEEALDHVFCFQEPYALKTLQE